MIAGVAPPETAFSSTLVSSRMAFLPLLNFAERALRERSERGTYDCPPLSERTVGPIRGFPPLQTCQRVNMR